MAMENTLLVVWDHLLFLPISIHDPTCDILFHTESEIEIAVLAAILGGLKLERVIFVHVLFVYDPWCRWVVKHKAIKSLFTLKLEFFVTQMLF